MPKVYPQGHPLRSAALKLQRANMHHNGLVRRMRSYVAASGPEVIVRAKGELKLPDDSKGFAVAKPVVYEILIDPRHKDVWGLVVGDIVANLHQSLDHIAWALANEQCRRRGTTLSATEAGEVSFPLRDDALTKHTHLRGLNWNDLRFFPPESFATVEKFQPYNRDNFPEAKFLWALHQLANLDKHRIATPVLVDVAVNFTGDAAPFVMVRLNKPDQSMFIATPEMAREMGRSLNPVASYEVQVSTGLPYPNDFMHVYGFRRMHRFLRDELLPAFAGFFK